MQKQPGKILADGMQNSYNCKKFISELAAAMPDLMIVSGLAYGIDIAAHKAALVEGLPTIGVLAHGLNTIYPSSHTIIAERMK